MGVECGVAINAYVFGRLIKSKVLSVALNASRKHTYSIVNTNRVECGL